MGSCAMGDNAVSVRCSAGSSVTSPVFDTDGELFICSNLQGKVFHVDGKEKATLQMVTDQLNTPSSIAFDPDGMMYVCDMAHAAILCLRENDELCEFVREYEGKQFVGPNCMIFDSSSNVYFTDSGPIGETTLAKPRGSVFCVDGPQQLLRPLAYECLAHPSGVALSKDEQQLFVCETMANRVLRFAQSPPGSFHMSVFHQMSGRLGPTAIACHPDTGNLYVAHSDFAGVEGATGEIVVLSAQGQKLRVLAVPAAEISGIAIGKDDDGAVELVVTEVANGTIFKIPDK